jgi:tRNA1(Val) A37 N6-methylase TrmN6
MTGPRQAAGRPDGPAASEDSLLGGRVRLRQPAAGYRVAVDPVLLAAAVPAGPESRVLDLGCGAGAAALCLLARAPEVEVTGWEVQEDLAALARESGRLNGHDERFQVVLADMAERSGVRPGHYDEVMCNPPHQPTAAPAAPDPSKARATHEGGTALADWIDAALFHARAKGGITLIHRADRLDDLLAAFRGRAGGIVVFPLWPGGGKPAKRVILRAVKGSKAPLRLAAGLTLHRADGTFTPEAKAVLRDGVALSLSGVSL